MHTARTVPLRIGRSSRSVGAATDGRRGGEPAAALMLTPDASRIVGVGRIGAYSKMQVSVRCGKCVNVKMLVGRDRMCTSAHTDLVLMVMQKEVGHKHDARSQAFVEHNLSATACCLLFPFLIPPPIALSNVLPRTRKLCSWRVLLEAILTLVTMHLRVAIAGAFLATAGAFSLSPMDGARAPMLRTNRAISRPLRVAPLSMNVDAFLEKLDSKTPQECHDLCTKEGYVYLDVRTNEENAAGTPAGAVNVPSHAKTDDGMLPMSSVSVPTRSVLRCDRSWPCEQYLTNMSPQTFLKLVAINFPGESSAIPTMIVCDCSSLI